MDESEYKKKLGDNIAKVRIARDITQKQLSLLTGRSHQTICSIERGRMWIPIPSLIKVATALRVPLQLLLPECSFYEEVTLVKYLHDTEEKDETSQKNTRKRYTKRNIQIP